MNLTLSRPVTSFTHFLFIRSAVYLISNLIILRPTVSLDTIKAQYLVLNRVVQAPIGPAVK